MISQQEARSIVYSYIDGDILKERCRMIKNPSSGSVVSKVFDIHHKTEDGDVFQTTIEITHNGFIAQYDKKHIMDENE